jgi:hypothetical protein
MIERVFYTVLVLFWLALMALPILALCGVVR